MADEGGSVPSSLEESLNSTGEPESDINKVIEGLREMRYEDNLSEDQKDTLERFADTLEEHSCAVGPQVQDTAEWDSNMSALPPQAASTPQRAESNDSGYLSLRDSKLLLSATENPLKDIEEELHHPAQSKKDEYSLSDEESELGEDQSRVHEETALPEGHEETIASAEEHKTEMVSGASAKQLEQKSVRSNASSDTGQPVQSEDMLGGSQMVHGLEGAPHRFNIPPEARCALVKITSEEDVKGIEEGSLKTTLEAIKHHHYLYKHQRTAKATSSKDANPSDNPSEYCLIVDGFISVVLVTEAAAKVHCMDMPDTIDAEAQEHCEWYLRQLKDSETITHSAKDLAATITGIRHSLSHGNAQYSYKLQDPTTGAPMFILYKRQLKAKRYEKVHGYTAEQFADVCSTMREVFLSWEKLAKYLLDEDKRQAPQIGAGELLRAVLGREGAMPELEGGDETEAVEAVED